jgi:hypothetical protein
LIMYNIDGTCFKNFEQNSVKGEFQRINVSLAKRQSFRGVYSKEGRHLLLTNCISNSSLAKNTYIKE